MKTEQNSEGTKIHFEQIPIALISQMATQSSALEQQPVSCSICRKSVILEQCKTDEHGNPVHENCYVTKVAKTTRLRLLRKRLRS